MLQTEFNQEVLLAALALCFEDEEAFLSVEQLIMRSYAPDASCAKKCINHLLLGGAVRCAAAESSPLSSAAEVRGLIRVYRPERMGNPLRTFVSETLRKLKWSLESDERCKRFFQALKQEVESRECIQYAKFFASRDNFKVATASADECNLHLLLSENTREQVFMLLWRSIKTQSELRTHSTEINFSELAERALEFYFAYKAKGRRIESYAWPKQIPVSKLANIVQILK